MSKSKFKDMVNKTASKVVKEEVEMPKTKAPRTKESKSFNIKSASKEDLRVLDVAWAIKTIREKNGMEITAQDEADLQAFAKQVKAPTLTTDITESIPSGVTGQLIEDAYYDTQISKVIPFETIQDPSKTRVLKNEGLSVFRTGEGSDATASNQTFTEMRYVVNKLMAFTEISTESLEDSIIDLAMEAIADMQRDYAEQFENAIINGHITVADFDGTAWDATDFDGNAVTAQSPVTICKGIRRVASEKQKVDFSGSALSDADFIDKIHEMQRAGGKYLTRNKIQRGEVALFVDQKVYQRMSRMTDVFERAMINGGDVVTKFDGIPVYELDFMPATNAEGIIGLTGNTLGSLVMANVKFLLAYQKANSTTVKTDENIKNDTQSFAMRSRVGFGTLYDVTETNYPVDTARKYLILGHNVA